MYTHTQDEINEILKVVVKRLEDGNYLDVRIFPSENALSIPSIFRSRRKINP